MRFKAFNNFSFGNSKNKNKAAVSPDGDEQVVEITEIETEANGKVKVLETVSKIILNPLAAAEIPIPLDAPPVRPHGPAAELTLEPEDLQGIPDILTDAVDSNASIKLDADIKLTKISEAKVSTSNLPAADAAPPAKETEEPKPEEADSLNSLFNQDEEEENPLASLINSLPDVTVQELMDDLSEIHQIIKEWGPGAKSIR